MLKVFSFVIVTQISAHPEKFRSTQFYSLVTMNIQEMVPQIIMSSKTKSNKSKISQFLRELTQNLMFISLIV